MSAKLKAKPEPTTNVRDALLAANGKRVQFNGNTYKIDCGYLDRAQLYFYCYAENLTPKTPEEAKYCLWDFYASDSEDAQKMLLKAATAGGWQA